MATVSEKASVDVLALPQDSASTCETLPTSASAQEILVEESVPRDFFVIPVPKYLRHNPKEELQFSLALNLLFAVATTFSTFLPSST